MKADYFVHKDRNTVLEPRLSLPRLLALTLSELPDGQLANCAIAKLKATSALKGSCQVPNVRISVKNPAWHTRALMFEFHQKLTPTLAIFQYASKNKKHDLHKELLFISMAKHLVLLVAWPQLQRPKFRIYLQ